MLGGDARARARLSRGAIPTTEKLAWATHLPHELVGFGAPLHLHERSDVAARAVLRLQRTAVLQCDVLADVVHEPLVALELLVGLERLWNEGKRASRLNPASSGAKEGRRRRRHGEGAGTWLKMRCKLPSRAWPMRHASW